MPVLSDWPIHLSVEDVLRIQHMDMAAIQRRPVLLETTKAGIRQAESLSKPVVVFRRMKVEKINPDGLVLEDGFPITSSFLAKQLSGADEVIVALCTIGSDVDRRASELMANNKNAEGYALESAGLVAIGQVNDQFYSSLEASARTSGSQISHRYSPGLPSWSVDEGHPDIFAILEAINTSVVLHESMQMMPMKSVSFVIGIGKELVRKGSECAFCGLREQCQFRSMHDGRVGEGVCQ